jgi:hypothetical protein
MNSGGFEMSDLNERVTGGMNVFQKILAKIPGFSGYIDRTNRRQADKMLRETIANRFEELWQRLASVQKDVLSEGGIEYMTGLESASLKLRQFIDRVRTASYGYAGFFDAIKVNQNELAQIYAFDLAMLEMEDEVGSAIDNVEASIGTDGLKAAIRNVTSKAQKCLDTFNKRVEVLKTEIPAEPENGNPGANS